MCASIHSKATSRVRGQERKLGRVSQSGGMLREFVCKMHAIFSLVQCQIPVAFPHCVSRCSSVSGRQHFPHREESLSLILASRTFVGTRSCSTTYHTDFISSDDILLRVEIAGGDTSGFGVNSTRRLRVAYVHQVVVPRGSRGFRFSDRFRGFGSVGVSF
jgi:hypothetical protein